MATVEVRTSLYTKEKRQPFPDLAACIAALPLCEMTGADEIHVVCEDETFGRLYGVEEVKAALAKRPEWSCLFGLGNVDPEHGWNYMEGRHLLIPR